MNVGDRVKIITPYSSWSGQTGLIVEDRGGHRNAGLPFAVDFDDNDLRPYFGENELSLIEAARPSGAPQAAAIADLQARVDTNDLNIERHGNAIETLKACVLYLLQQQEPRDHGHAGRQGG